MKAKFKITAAVLAIAALAGITAPAYAGPARIEFSVGNGYYAPAYAQPEVIYDSPVPVYQYRDEDELRRQRWREHKWRERERREQYWTERNEWRERQMQRERRHREREWREEHREREYYGGDRWEQ